MNNHTPTKKVQPLTLVSSATANILKSVKVTKATEISKRSKKPKEVFKVSDADAIEFIGSKAESEMKVIKAVFTSVFEELDKVKDRKEKARQAFIKGEVKAIKTGSLKKSKSVDLQKILAPVKKKMLWLRNRATEVEEMLKDPYAQYLFKQYAKVPQAEEPEKKGSK